MTRNLTSQSDPASAGFTLLEVLVAIGLLAFLSLAIFQTTTSSWSTNARLGAEATETTGILLGLAAVESDLAQIYTPRLGSIPIKPDDKVTKFWSAPVRADGFRRSRLTGKSESISFVANNNRRVEADSPQSDFQKILWEVERDPKGTYSLYRTTDWDVFRYEEDVSKKPTRVAVLEGLSSAKFFYYRHDTKKWEDTWESEDIYAKEETRFPDLIKLKIEAPDPQNNANQMPWEIVVRPNSQLNYLDAAARANAKQRFE